MRERLGDVALRGFNLVRVLDQKNERRVFAGGKADLLDFAISIRQPRQRGRQSARDGFDFFVGLGASEVDGLDGALSSTTSKNSKKAS